PSLPEPIAPVGGGAAEEATSGTMPATTPRPAPAARPATAEDPSQAALSALWPRRNSTGEATPRRGRAKIMAYEFPAVVFDPDKIALRSRGLLVQSPFGPPGPTIVLQSHSFKYCSVRSSNDSNGPLYLL